MLKSLTKCLKMASNIEFLLNSSGDIDNLVKHCIFFPKNWLLRNRVALNILIQLTWKREGGWVNADMADNEGRGVGQMLTLASEGGRWGQDPQFLANIFCEQPLN